MLHGNHKPVVLVPLALVILLHGSLAHSFERSPPPLPAGSGLVLVQIGMSPQERLRSARGQPHGEHSGRDEARVPVADAEPDAPEFVREESSSFSISPKANHHEAPVSSGTQ